MAMKKVVFDFRHVGLSCSRGTGKMRFGFSLVQVLVAASLIGGLSFVLANLLNQMGKGQRHVENRAAAMALRQRIVGALQSSTAMQKTASANPNLSSCVTCVNDSSSCTATSCPNSATPLALSIVDASGASIVPALGAGSGPNSDDAGGACSTGGLCRWRSSASFFRASPTDTTLHMSGTLVYVGSAPGEAPLAPVAWALDVSASLFSGTPSAQYLIGGPCVQRCGATSTVDGAVYGLQSECLASEVSIGGSCNCGNSGTYVSASYIRGNGFWCQKCPVYNNYTQVYWPAGLACATCCPKVPR